MNDHDCGDYAGVSNGWYVCTRCRAELAATTQWEEAHAAFHVTLPPCVLACRFEYSEELRRAAVAMAERFAAEYRKLSVLCDGEVFVLDEQAAKAHGWMPGALAEVSHEGGADMVEMTLSGRWMSAYLFMEPYASYMVGVYAR